MKRLKKALIWALAGSMVLSFAGCGDGSKTSNSSGSANEFVGGTNFSSDIPEYTVDRGEYFISAFGDPRALTKEAWQTLPDCNINYVYIDPWYNSTSIGYENILTQAIELCGEVGIKGLIMPNNTHQEDAPLTSFEQYEVDYTQYEGFGGFYAFDEPSSQQFSSIVTDYAKYKESKYQDYLYLITMMYQDVNGSGLSRDQFYDKYSDEILTKFEDHTRILSFDFYPLQYSAKLSQNQLPIGWLESLDRNSYYAKQANAEFYNYLQTCSMGYGSARLPETLQDIRFQVAASMAFGAKGVQCFTYSEFANEDFDGCMLTAAGQKTDIWYYCQQVFKEIRNWEDVYLSFDYQGIMTVETDASSKNADIMNEITKCKIDSHSRIKDMTVERDLLVGVFTDKDGYDGFLFTTCNDPYYQKYNQISVEFNNASKALVYWNGQRQVVDLTNGMLHWDLAAGDILFAIPIK